MEIQAGKCQIKSSEILDMRHEILIALNSTFRTSFEGLYLEWVHVKRLSFAQYPSEMSLLSSSIFTQMLFEIIVMLARRNDTSVGLHSTGSGSELPTERLFPLAMYYTQSTSPSIFSFFRYSTNKEINIRCEGYSGVRGTAVRGLQGDRR